VGLSASLALLLLATLATGAQFLLTTLASAPAGLFAGALAVHGVLVATTTLFGLGGEQKLSASVAAPGGGGVMLAFFGEFFGRPSGSVLGKPLSDGACALAVTEDLLFELLNLATLRARLCQPFAYSTLVSTTAFAVVTIVLDLGQTSNLSADVRHLDPPLLQLNELIPQETMKPETCNIKHFSYVALRQVIMF